MNSARFQPTSKAAKTAVKERRNAEIEWRQAVSHQLAVLGTLNGSGH